MKIDKKQKTVISSESIVTNDEDLQLNDMVKNDAEKYIRSAIKSLGGLLRRTGDPKYKEAIANLSVVLFDIKDSN